MNNENTQKSIAKNFMEIDIKDTSSDQEDSHQTTQNNGHAVAKPIDHNKIFVGVTKEPIYIDSTNRNTQINNRIIDIDEDDGLNVSSIPLAPRYQKNSDQKLNN